jgi:hypothetical protein
MYVWISPQQTEPKQGYSELFYDPILLRIFPCTMWEIYVSYALIGRSLYRQAWGTSNHSVKLPSCIQYKMKCMLCITSYFQHTVRIEQCNLTSWTMRHSEGVRAWEVWQCDSSWRNILSQGTQQIMHVLNWTLTENEHDKAKDFCILEIIAFELTDTILWTVHETYNYIDIHRQMEERTKTYV